MFSGAFSGLLNLDKIIPWLKEMSSKRECLRVRDPRLPPVENGGDRLRDLNLLENRYLAFRDKYGMLRKTATHGSA